MVFVSAFVACCFPGLDGVADGQDTVGELAEKVAEQNTGPGLDTEVGVDQGTGAAGHCTARAAGHCTARAAGLDIVGAAGQDTVAAGLGTAAVAPDIEANMREDTGRIVDAGIAPHCIPHIDQRVVVAVGMNTLRNTVDFAGEKGLCKSHPLAETVAGTSKDSAGFDLAAT